ncbi:Autoinducer 2 sensor kinase/phosphatase LuxQ [Pseudodesulfovibrio hydrargyri]|uniref:Sensory/regulatory protein RpfC n=2 Tax=Pseudodesulfovibrio hydrargyri TaxID=2125990 RepID=A0A1J5N7V5_9BACT|nr:Autoinducer 2 sensor kinase/phosphatase LuxQ [Pseudodesulfovibrio hydrargyri]
MLKVNERVFPGVASAAIRAVLAALFVLCLAAPARAARGVASAWAAQAWAGPQVLLISSYHPGFPTFFRQIEGIESVLEPAGVDLDVEYMDSKRFNSPEDVRDFRHMLADKLARLPRYDLILTADDNALRFALDNRGILFPDTPVVFFGVNDQPLAHSMNDDDRVTGVIEAVSMEETLRAAFTLQPGLRTVYALVDGTTSARADLLTYLSMRSAFPDRNLAVLSLTDLTWAGLAERTRALGPADAILLLSAYRDAAGATVSFDEGLKRILTNTRVPVYDLWEHGLNLGAIGGKIISHFEQGRMAARMGLAILGGTPVRHLPVIEGNEANRYIFDYRVLARFGIDPDALPEGSRVLNSPDSLWSAHTVELSLAAGAMVAMTVLVLLLLAYVSRLRRARIGLRESEERLQMSLEATSDGLWDWCMDPEKVYFSPGYFTMLGYEVDAFPHAVASWLELLHPDDREAARDVVTAHAESGREFRTEFRLRNASGGWTWVMARGKTIDWTRDGRPRRVVGTHTDITDRKRFEERLVQAKEAAEAANRVKDEFIANISHEVRTPLNGVMGMLQLLQTAGLNAEQRELVDTALHSSRNLLRVLNDLLDFSKIQAGKLDIREAPFDLTGLVAESLDFFKLQAVDKDLKLTADIDPSARKNYLGDAGRIRQILFNLVGNAVKFTDKGAITVEVCELWHPEPGRKRLLVTVRDTGIGIAEKDLSRIFAPFSQVDGSLTRAYQGTGLGLPIVSKLVRLMGGNCEVDSEPGKGTAIRFFLSVGDAGGAEAENASAPGPDADRPLRLLLVEDERVNRVMARRLLERMGHTVAEAENGRDCLTRLRDHPFDAVLMDVQMPFLNGLDATRAIRTAPELAHVSTIPVIGLSAHAARHDRTRALEAGMNEYLVKPFEKSDLERALRKVVKAS